MPSHACYPSPVSKDIHSQNNLSGKTNCTKTARSVSYHQEMTQRKNSGNRNVKWQASEKMQIVCTSITEMWLKHLQPVVQSYCSRTHLKECPWYKFWSVLLLRQWSKIEDYIIPMPSAETTVILLAQTDTCQRSTDNSCRVWQIDTRMLGCGIHCWPQTAFWPAKLCCLCLLFHLQGSCGLH